MLLASIFGWQVSSYQVGILRCLTNATFPDWTTQEKDKKYMLQLDNLRLRDMEAQGFLSKKSSFAVVNSETRLDVDINPPSIKWKPIDNHTIFLLYFIIIILKLYHSLPFKSLSPTQKQSLNARVNAVVFTLTYYYF